MWKNDTLIYGSWKYELKNTLFLGSTIYFLLEWTLIYCVWKKILHKKLEYTLLYGRYGQNSPFFYGFFNNLHPSLRKIKDPSLRTRGGLHLKKYPCQRYICIRHHTELPSPGPLPGGWGEIHFMIRSTCHTTKYTLFLYLSHHHFIVQDDLSHHHSGPLSPPFFQWTLYQLYHWITSLIRYVGLKGKRGCFSNIVD